MGFPALSPDDVRSGKAPIDDCESLRNALALAFVHSINCFIQARRAAEFEHPNVSDDADVAQHYAYEFESGIVSDDVLRVVLAAYCEAGWVHSRVIRGYVIIAREPYVFSPPRGEQPCVSSNVSCLPGEFMDDADTPHHAGGYSAPAITTRSG